MLVALDDVNDIDRIAWSLAVERFEHADQVAENGGTLAEHG
jgi:hypothetical protein